ncbi:L-lactate dehydrogenase [Aliiruegeria haliotis]|uniref:L-lactate dehydrogenase n=1 Tax=Aliiruegeria haliotis TaxID=1280846 RepID=A0A2T0RT34_9RHOB|nr:L-lactate dehydrogenase [Aliiruegeria haliotis]PRY24287.1 L-lactate dehydrogenase [Aliiruegeria haliotis]
MKVGIIGAGMVGSTAAYAIGLLGVAHSVVLVDLDPAMARAQAEDISHGMPFASTTIVTSGGYEDLAGAEIVILAAGVGQKPGESRLSLLSRNADVFRAVIGSILSVVPDPILLVASNPVDIMTTVARRLSGLPAHRVIGSGTILDTARFRSLLSRHVGLAPQSIHAYVLGEHGDSEVLAWSGARAGNMSLDAFAAYAGAPITEDIRRQIDDGVRYAAYSIIEGKGATYYGIGAGLARLVGAIVSDGKVVMSVSTETNGIAGLPQVAYSIPRVIGRRGVELDLAPDINDAERMALERSATLLKETAQALGT